MNRVYLQKRARSRKTARRAGNIRGPTRYRPRDGCSPQRRLNTRARPTQRARDQAGSYEFRRKGGIQKNVGPGRKTTRPDLIETKAQSANYESRRRRDTRDQIPDCKQNTGHRENTRGQGPNQLPKQPIRKCQVPRR